MSLNDVFIPAGLLIASAKRFSSKHNLFATQTGLVTIHLDLLKSKIIRRANRVTYHGFGFRFTTLHRLGS